MQLSVCVAIFAMRSRSSTGNGCQLPGLSFHVPVTSGPTRAATMASEIATFQRFIASPSDRSRPAGRSFCNVGARASRFPQAGEARAGSRQREGDSSRSARLGCSTSRSKLPQTGQLPRRGGPSEEDQNGSSGDMRILKNIQGVRTKRSIAASL